MNAFKYNVGEQQILLYLAELKLKYSGEQV